MPFPQRSPLTRALLVAALLLFAACAARSPRPAESSALGRAAGVIAFGFDVRDMEQALSFFAAFDVTVTSDRELAELALADGDGAARARQVTLAVGSQKLVLTQHYVPAARLVTSELSNDQSFQHVAIVVRDMDAAYAQLANTGATPVSVAPQTLPQSNKVAAGIRALYFRDPEGHALELIAFPADKGDARWHSGDPRLYLGIDHSAIVTRDTEASLRVYRDVLGMRVVSESVNEGAEQEALSAVPGARVRVTSLRGESGPGIELLEYLRPRSTPASSGAISRATPRSETILAVDCAACVVRTLGRGVVHAGSAVLADADGHVLRLVQRKREQKESVSP